MHIVPAQHSGFEIFAGENQRWAVACPEYVNSREFFYHANEIEAKWTEADGTWRLEQNNEEYGLQSTYEIAPLDNTALKLTYTATNNGEKAIHDLEADFCHSCAYSPWAINAKEIAHSWVNECFHGPRREQNTEWTKRSFVPTTTGLKVVGDRNLQFAVPSNRMVAQIGKNLADLPIILCQSVDRTKVYAAGWDRCARLYCAINSCIHTIVWLGTLSPGAQATREGRFYFMETDPYSVLARFQEDLAGKL